MSIGGGFISGILIGYFLKKLIKILLFAVGGIVALLLYLQQQELITVDIKKLEGSFTFILNSVISTFDKTAQIGDTTSLAVPLVGGLSAGFAIGLAKG